MNIDQKVCGIQLKFSLIQLVSVEPEAFLPSKIIGHVTQHCNHMVSSPDKNNNIKKVYITSLGPNIHWTSNYSTGIVILEICCLG